MKFDNLKKATEVTPTKTAVNKVFNIVRWVFVAMFAIMALAFMPSFGSFVFLLYYGLSAKNVISGSTVLFLFQHI